MVGDVRHGGVWVMPCLTQPVTQVQPNGLYKLMQPYQYKEFNIPVGFLWDGASVPRIFWSISGCRPGGRFLGPSLIHDALYRSGGQSEYDESGRQWTRKETDVLFHTLMKEAGIAWLQCHRAYWAVRWGGWYAWKTK